MGADVAVFGEVLADCFPDGPVLGGAPFNVARHLAAFGLAPLMLTAIGDDALGREALREFSRLGMRADGVQRTAVPTGMVDVELRGDGSHAFHIRSGAAWDAIEHEPALRCLGGLAAGSWLYTGTLALRGAMSREAGLALMQAHSGARFIDLNWREGHVEPELALQVLARADAVKLNDDELYMVGGWLGLPESGIDSQAREVVGRLRPGLLLVTCGADGSRAFGPDGERLALEAGVAVPDVADTVGAGDAFSAVALAGLVAGWPLPLLLARANAFAAGICTVRGAMPRDGSLHAAHGAAWA